AQGRLGRDGANAREDEGSGVRGRGEPNSGAWRQAQEQARSVEAHRVELEVTIVGQPAGRGEIRWWLDRRAAIIAVALDVTVTVGKADRATVLLNDAAGDVEAPPPSVGDGATAAREYGARTDAVVLNSERFVE